MKEQDSDDDHVRSVLFWCLLELERMPAHLNPPPVYVRLFVHGFLHRMLGLKLYREVTRRRLPSKRWSRAAPGRNSVRDQILEWRGLSADEPLRVHQARDLAAMIRFFRLTIVGKTLLDTSTLGVTRVCVRLRSLVDGAEMSLYADVEYEYSMERVAVRSGPPCPSCGLALRTPKARQCSGCGADWHEPDVSPGVPGGGVTGA